jgi:hypothetical protein
MLDDPHIVKMFEEEEQESTILRELYHRSKLQI